MSLEWKPSAWLGPQSTRLNGFELASENGFQYTVIGTEAHVRSTVPPFSSFYYEEVSREDAKCRCEAFAMSVWNAIPQWIDVNDFLPNPEEFVWVNHAMNISGVAMYLKNEKVWIVKGQNKAITNPFLRVTHWMPLPPPPKI